MYSIRVATDKLGLMGVGRMYTGESGKNIVGQFQRERSFITRTGIG